jgi:hypothetical protein
MAVSLYLDSIATLSYYLLAAPAAVVFVVRIAFLGLCVLPIDVR